MLYETFWAALSRNWLNAVTVVRTLPRGRAALKRSLEELGPLDVAALPYNEEVLAYVRRWREQGGRAVLVSATAQGLVERIADHVVFFFFSLAAMKRQTELVSSVEEGEKKAHGRGYIIGDLPLVTNMAIASGYVSVLVMALQINSIEVGVLYPETAPLWGICLVLLLWLSRMIMLAHRGLMQDDPVVFAAQDKVSIVCGGVIGGLAVAGMVM